MKPQLKSFIFLLVVKGMMTSGQVQAATGDDKWELGLVLDGAITSQRLELGARDKGLGLGHSDVLVRGAFNAHWSAEATLGLHTDDQKIESHVENAWVQTRALPLGLQFRVGRFASQIGYLNELHPHADDFSERPLLYRGFLGGHWYDDGLRLNWTAPSPFYLRLGAELFTGKNLVTQATSDSTSRVSALNLKMGNDMSASSSWQWGLSLVNNQREAEVELHDASVSDHVHRARYSGKHMLISDLVWKWAPDGNNRNQQLRLIWEYAQVSGINRYADGGSHHRASTLSAVWKFHPAWQVGFRTDGLAVHKAENAGGVVSLTSGRLKENAIMLVHQPTHRQTLRLQLTQQRASGANEEGEAVFAGPASRSIQLQYVIEFGAHGAHSY